MAAFKNFVTAEWLLDRLHDVDTFVLDCRFDLFNPAQYGSEGYAKDHIEGAYYLDMDTDWSEDKGTHGGRRGTPDPQILGAKLAALGINMDSTIVCYDDGVYSAPRAWWQLRYMGYEKVYVLDGGLTRWKKLAYPLSSEVPASRGQGACTPLMNECMYASKDDVKAALGKEGSVIVDCRAYRRYSGEYEPLYSKKGHIPGAISIHYLSNLKEDSGGTLIGTPEQWRKNLAPCLDAEEVFVYCGSGIEACINFMFLDELGKPARLYVGSMSDWVSYDDVDVEACVE